MLMVTSARCRMFDVYLAVDVFDTVSSRIIKLTVYIWRKVRSSMFVAVTSRNECCQRAFVPAVHFGC